MDQIDVRGQGKRKRAIGWIAPAIALFCGLASTSPSGAGADTTVEAVYSATLSGFPIASGTLAFSIASNGEYSTNLSARIVGLATIIANRVAAGSSAGRAIAGVTSPRSYALSIQGGASENTVRMDFSGSAVSKIQTSDPPTGDFDTRVPILPRHKRSVVDPLAAFVVALGRNEKVGPNVCNRTIKVFDGRVRYDLRLVYGATTEIKGTEGSYSGNAIICAVAYRPIAGYRPLTAEQAKFERNIEFSIWFIPVAGTDVMLPYKVVIGTPVGLLAVTAGQFSVKGSQSAELKPEPKTQP